MRTVLLIGSLLGSLAACATPGIPPTDVVISPELSSSTVSEGPDDRSVARALALGARGGYRWGAWGVGGSAELNLFRQRELDGSDDQLAAVLIGVDGEVLSANGYVRSRVGGGLAVLLEGTSLDEPGLTGFYVDLRPGGFRVLLREGLRLTFDPLSLAILVPDASGIPLVDIQYRANLAVEFSL